MVVAARADCFPLAVQEGLKLAELKERVLHGLREEMAWALTQRAAAQPEIAAQACARASTPTVAAAQVRTGNEDLLSARLAKCQALAEEAICGEAQAAVSVAGMLSDTSSEVRQAALEALNCIVDFAPRGVVDAMAASMSFSDAGLRWRSQEHSIIAGAIVARIGA